jgi:hypothetical protein
MELEGDCGGLAGRKFLGGVEVVEKEDIDVWACRSS